MALFYLINDSPDNTFPFTPDISLAYLGAADKFRIVEGMGLDYNKRQVWDGGENRPEGDHNTCAPPHREPIYYPSLTQNLTDPCRMLLIGKRFCISRTTPAYQRFYSTLGDFLNKCSKVGK